MEIPFGLTLKLSDLAFAMRRIKSAHSTKRPCRRCRYSTLMSYADKSWRGRRDSTPDLGKVVLLLQRLPHVIGAVYKKRAGYSPDITMTQ
jgi:hypothetical protein